jgi:hypothetical protein
MTTEFDPPLTPAELEGKRQHAEWAAEREAMRKHLEADLNATIARLFEEGFVVRVMTVPNQPLSSGNYTPVGTVSHRRIASKYPTDAWKRPE